MGLHAACLPRQHGYLKMRVNELLDNPEKFVGQVVELEGVIYIERHYMKQWYFLDSMNLSNKLLPINRRMADDGLYLHLTPDITNILASRIPVYRNDNATCILKQIILTCNVTYEENQAQILSENIEKIIYPVPNANCTIHIKKDIQFDDVYLKENTITPVLALRDNLDFYMGKFIRVDGVLRGVTKPSEMSWIASLENSDAFRHLSEAPFALLLERKGIINQIVSPRAGGEFGYWDKVQVIGRVSESNQPAFVAMLTDMTHLLIKQDDNRCIVVHHFD
jgi:hypothetical protein